MVSVLGRLATVTFGRCVPWGLMATVGVTIVLDGSPAAALAGDANCDGVVTVADVDALLDAMFVPSACASADVNGDGQVTAADVSAEMGFLATPEPTPTGSVPPTPTAGGPTRTATRVRSATPTRTGVVSPTASATATRSVTVPPGPSATPSPTATASAAASPTPSPTVAPPASATATSVATVPPTNTPTLAAPTPTLTLTPVPALTPTSTATPPATTTPTFAQIPTATPTATRTIPANPGPLVTFFGMADTQGCVACPGTPLCVCSGPTPTPAYENGIRVYQAPGSNGIIMLVVEGKPRVPSDPAVGGSLTEPLPDGRPDLQVVASRPLGNGNPAVVCPGTTGSGSDGIPSATFPDPDAAALRDFACRFLVFNVNDPCTLNSNGLSALGNASGSPTTQFCGYYMGSGQTVPVGDTTFTVRLRDTGGNLGPPEQIIVRRQ